MALFSKIFSKLRAGSVSNSDWEELRSSLIDADLGSAFTDELVALAKSMKPSESESAITEALKSKLSSAARSLAKVETGFTTIMVVGVNGTGKTTSVAKLMNALPLANVKSLPAYNMLLEKDLTGVDTIIENSSPDRARFDRGAA